MNVMLKEVPYSPEDRNALNWIDVGADRCFGIIIENTYTIGYLYISDDITISDETRAYVNWLEFLSVFRMKHLLKPVMDAIYDMFGEFCFESSEDHVMKYQKIGAISLGTDDITENTIFKYSNPREDYNDPYESEYCPSASRGDYSPSNPWDAPGMSIHDFI
jgi:hypothetical protein